MSGIREYLKTAYDADRSFSLAHLGGKCASCGSADELEFDHIEKNSKAFNLSDRFGRVKRPLLLKELSKCQLLCKRCHTEKTIFDSGNKPAKGTHGTLSSYRYCKCDKCREAKRAYMTEYHRQRKTLDVGRNGGPQGAL